MPKNSLYIILLLLAVKISSAQTNLIPNPSFEDTLNCPYSAGLINYSPPWYDATGASADYFNICNTNSVNVPLNYIGNQYAHFGNAYAGIATYNNLNLREYIQIHLISSLVTSKNYYIEFYVSLGDTASVSSNNMGMYFSDTAITGPAGSVLNVIPQINNDPIANPLTNKIGWSKIAGNFIANGTENYITIGNFLDDASTDTTHVYGGSFPDGYYYIDDVSVICTDCPAIVSEELMIPTLLGSNEIFEIKVLPANSTLIIFNTLGQVVYNNSSYDNKFTMANLSSGIYYYYLKFADENIYKGKLCVVK